MKGNTRVQVSQPRKHPTRPVPAKDSQKSGLTGRKVSHSARMEPPNYEGACPLERLPTQPQRTEIKIQSGTGCGSSMRPRVQTLVSPKNIQPVCVSPVTESRPSALHRSWVPTQAPLQTQSCPMAPPGPIPVVHLALLLLLTP
jgi:hypothetical protein